MMSTRRPLGGRRRSGPDVTCTFNDGSTATVTPVDDARPKPFTTAVPFSKSAFTYRPNGDYAGLDAFAYTISDGTSTAQGDGHHHRQRRTELGADRGRRQRRGGPVRRADRPPVLGFLANDTEADGEPISVVVGHAPTVLGPADADRDPLPRTLVTSTQHGKLVFFGDQLAFTYEPNAGFAGQDSFTCKVNDGKVDSAVAAVTLT